ncbi:uncharacterized protein LOC126887736 isoform X1 [Diabrotica virgifera virgifera]|uniref:Craniofacial development protein 2-like n=1 Tax=Diabrotica virgifera virgifera TaxID=50390 RepID=A0ABM5KMI6_DIAVI|nr:uncharacterized protein LOC126887736 isoform X1 [Diabrotica virgifera virgifera]
MGDMNGRVEKQNYGIEKWLGKEGEETRNDNGTRNINLCIENDLIIGNSKFTHKDVHKYTREERSRGERSIIDYFLINFEIWKAVKNIKVKRSAEIGSNHYLVKMSFRIIKYIQNDKKRKIIKEKIRSYKLKEIEVEKRYHKCLEELRKRANKYQNIEERWKDYKHSLLVAAKESCGVTRISNNSKKTHSMVDKRLRKNSTRKETTVEKILNR